MEYLVYNLSKKYGTLSYLVFIFSTQLEISCFCFLYTKLEIKDT
jgi:hypothetical protein